MGEPIALRMQMHPHPRPLPEYRAREDTFRPTACVGRDATPFGTTSRAVPAILMPAMGDTSAGDIRFLVPLAGPALDAVRLEPKPGGLTLGRHERADLLMPAGAEGVSRFHARFTFDAAERRWRLTDLSSRWGTFVNGVRV